MEKRYVTHKYKEFGSLVSGPLERYLFFCGVKSNLSDVDAVKYAPDERERRKRLDMYLYYDLDVYAKSLDTTVYNLLLHGGWVNPNYIMKLSDGDESNLENVDRYEYTHDFHHFLMHGTPEQKSLITEVIFKLISNRPWIKSSFDDISPYNRLKLFYQNTIQVRNRMQDASSPRLSLGYRGTGILETCNVFECLMQGIPKMGNASADYAFLCRLYHLSFHWVFAQKSSVSIYGFPHSGDERMFSIFTLLNSSEQRVLSTAVKVAKGV